MTARAVVTPKEHDGVGRALRACYQPRACDMPSDLAALLEKLV